MALADYAAPIADARIRCCRWCESRAADRDQRGGHAHARDACSGSTGRIRTSSLPTWRSGSSSSGCVDAGSRAVVRTGLRTLALAGGVASNIKATRASRACATKWTTSTSFRTWATAGWRWARPSCAALRRPRRRLDALLGRSRPRPGLRRGRDARRARGQGCGSCEPTDDRRADGRAARRRHGSSCGSRGGWNTVPARSAIAACWRGPIGRRLRDRLNLLLKRRVWYQPFCPSMLESDARAAVQRLEGRAQPPHDDGVHGRSRHVERRWPASISVDGSCRPQIVREDATGRVRGAAAGQARRRWGIGAVLNT